EQSVGQKIQEGNTAYYLPAREHAEFVRIFFKIADDHQDKPSTKGDVKQQAHRNPRNMVAEQRRRYRSSLRAKQRVEFGEGAQSSDAWKQTFSKRSGHRDQRIET